MRIIIISNVIFYKFITESPDSLKKVVSLGKVPNG